MKSLHLTNAYHPTSGGIRTWYRQVLASAGAHGWDARLVVPGERSAVEEVNPHARIYHVRAPRSPVFDQRYRLILPHRYLFPGGEIRRILLAEAPDIVEVADKYALVWLAGIIRKNLVRGLRRPVLIGFSFERMDDNVAAFLGANGALRPAAATYMSRCYFPLFDVHLAVSEYTAAELEGARRGPQPVHVQPCGVEAGAFSPRFRSEALRRTLLDACGGTGDTTLLLYVGRLSPEKNIRLLVDAMGELDGGPGDFRLVVAGSGPLAGWLQECAGRLAPGRILLWGQVQDRQALAQLYATCDVFVHPNAHEPFGIAPLEAMASGIPAVLPRHGGVLTYADDSNAWLAAPAGGAFADAVRALRSDPEEARRRTERARETAVRFDTSRMMDQLFSLYGTLTGSGRHQAAAPRGEPGGRNAAPLET